jgi:hypothetical protein
MALKSGPFVKEKIVPKFRAFPSLNVENRNDGFGSRLIFANIIQFEKLKGVGKC